MLQNVSFISREAFDQSAVTFDLLPQGSPSHQSLLHDSSNITLAFLSTEATEFAAAASNFKGSTESVAPCGRACVGDHDAVRRQII